MKTLRYLLCGKVASLDDCFDLCRRERARLLRVETTFEDCFLDFDVFRRLLIRSTWELRGKTFSCDTASGGYLLSESRRKKQRATEKANAFLEAQLDRIREKGLRLEAGGRNSFTLQESENHV